MLVHIAPRSCSVGLRLPPSDVCSLHQQLRCPPHQCHHCPLQSSFCWDPFQDSLLCCMLVAHVRQRCCKATSQQGHAHIYNGDKSSSPYEPQIGVYSKKLHSTDRCTEIQYKVRDLVSNVSRYQKTIKVSTSFN